MAGFTNMMKQSQKEEENNRNNDMSFNQMEAWTEAATKTSSLRNLTPEDRFANLQSLQRKVSKVIPMENTVFDFDDRQSFVSALTMGTNRPKTRYNVISTSNHSQKQSQEDIIHNTPPRHGVNNQSQSGPISPAGSKQRQPQIPKKLSISSEASSSKPPIMECPKNLFGRERELHFFWDTFARIAKSKSRCEVVWMDGPLGCGKTALLESLRDPWVKHYQGYFVTGRWESSLSSSFTSSMSSGTDASSSSLLYAAWIEALTDLCELLLADYTVQQQQKLAQSFTPSDVQRLGQLMGTSLHRFSGMTTNTTSITTSEINTETIKTIQDDHRSLLPTAKVSKKTSKKNRDVTIRGGMENEIDDDASISTVSQHALLVRSLQKFLSSVSSSKHPIIVSLDNVQYADPLSLTLLQGLTRDPKLRNILFILVHRSQDMNLSTVPTESREKTSNNPIQTTTETFLDLTRKQEFLASWKRKLQKRVQMTEIVLQNLCLDAVYKLIHSSLTDSEENATRALAEVVYRKTHGHPYCVQQFLENLKRDGYLYRIDNDDKSGGSGGNAWMWDLARIQCETDVTDNVANLVTDKVQRCHRYIQLILKVASAIGFEFDRKLLEAVIVLECVAASARANQTIVSNIHQKIRKYLAVALQEELIEKTGYSGKLKFTHDRVKECIYSLIPEGKSREELHHRIGIALEGMLQQHQQNSNDSRISNNRYNYDDAVPEWMVYAAAEQMNRAGSQHRHTLEHLHRNVRASKLAHSQGAFLPAVEFVREAQEAIDSHVLFENHYDLARDLYTQAAELEYAVGEFERSEIAARLVFLYAKKPEDKMGTFRILVDAMDAQGKGHNSIEIALSVLQELGENFPSKPKAMNVIMELMQTQQLLQNTEDEFIINLPPLKDERKLHVLKVISVFGTMTALVGCELIALLSTLRIVQSSLKDGIAPIATLAFASFGNAMAMTGHPQEAYRFGNVALALLERFETPSSLQAHTMAIVHGGCRHWKHAYRKSLKRLMMAYEKGMSVGDIKFSFLAAHNYLVGCLESGVKLSQVEVDMRTFCEGLDDITAKQNAAFRTMIAPVWQQVLNLMGKSEHPQVLTGAAMDEETFLEDTNTRKFTGGVLAYIKSKLFLAYHFDNFRSAEILVEELEKDERMVFWHFTVYQLKMIYCLTQLHLYEETKERRYHDKARQIIEKLQTWMEQGNVNCRPILSLLIAEEAAVTSAQFERDSNTFEATKQRFDAAIHEVQRSKLSHVEALTFERAAMACFRLEEYREGATYLVEARDAYSRWGAHAKVEHLECKFHLLFQTPSGGSPQPQSTSNSSPMDSIQVRASP